MSHTLPVAAAGVTHACVCRRAVCHALGHSIVMTMLLVALVEWTGVKGWFILRQSVYGASSFCVWASGCLFIGWEMNIQDHLHITLRHLCCCCQGLVDINRRP